MNVREIWAVLVVAGGAAAFGWLMRRDRINRAQRRRVGLNEWENEGGSLQAAPPASAGN